MLFDVKCNLSLNIFSSNKQKEKKKRKIIIFFKEGTVAKARVIKKHPQKKIQKPTGLSKKKTRLPQPSADKQVDTFSLKN